MWRDGFAGCNGRDPSRSLSWISENGRFRVMIGSCHQAFDRINCLNAATSTCARAVERRGSASEFELALPRPTLQKTIDKTSVEDVARSSGVGNRDTIGSRIVEFCPIPREHASLTQSCGAEAIAEAFVYRGQRFAQIGLEREATWDVAAGDEVVDMGKQCLDAWIEFVEISDNWNSGRTRPLCGQGGGSGVVTIEVKGASGDDPFALQLFGPKGQARVTLPQHGALAHVVDEDEGLLAGAVWCGQEMRFNAEPREFRAVKRRSGVVANFPDVPCAHAPLLASGQSCGDVATWKHVRGTKRDLGSARGIFR